MLGRQSRDRSRHPLAYGANLESVRLGALLHITPGDEATGREAALLARQILEGADAGTLPVVPPVGVELGINLAGVLALGLAVPSELLGLAGENLFRERLP